MRKKNSMKKFCFGIVPLHRSDHQGQLHTTTGIDLGYHTHTLADAFVSCEVSWKLPLEGSGPDIFSKTAQASTTTANVSAEIFLEGFA